jgi:hypothetical protein
MYPPAVNQGQAHPVKGTITIIAIKNVHRQQKLQIRPRVFQGLSARKMRVVTAPQIL